MSVPAYSVYFELRDKVLLPALDADMHGSPYTDLKLHLLHGRIITPLEEFALLEEHEEDRALDSEAVRMRTTPAF